MKLRELFDQPKYVWFLLYTFKVGASYTTCADPNTHSSLEEAELAAALQRANLDEWILIGRKTSFKREALVSIEIKRGYADD